MSGNTAINIGVGIVGGIIGFFIGGPMGALYGFSLASMGASMLLGPEKTKNGAPRPDEIQVNQSAEDATIPVIFGTSRVAANFIYVGKDDLETEKIEKDGEGKGAEDQVVGYRYTLPISYGLCMGEVDALVRVLASPGQKTMAKFSPALTFTGGAKETITIESVQKQDDIERREGGEADFYPGSWTQGSSSATKDINHRGVCWVHFPKYVMDGVTTPTSLLFEIRRIPKVTYSNGSAVAGFPTRAAISNAFEEWYDANPAAVAWEVLQNPVWGKGMNTDNLDVESFELAANYYRNQRIGMSTAMGAQTVTEFMRRLRELFGLWTYWDGEKMRARCIYDRTNAYLYRPIITAEDVIDSPIFSRASLSGTMNEIRLSFTNRKNNWQQEVATAMDLAHVETVGGVRTQSVDGAEIGTRRAAELIAHSMLREMAYPAASCRLKVHRTFSGLQPGSFICLRWEEWREGSIAETYWRVVDIEDDDQTSEGISLSLMEDIYATARFSPDDGAWEEPSGTIDDDTPINDIDLVFGDLTGDRPAGTLTPVILWEPNIHMTGGLRRIAPLPTREKAYVQSVTVRYAHLGSSATQALGVSTLMPINGTLLDAIPTTTPLLSRSAAGEFRIQLYHPTQADTLVAATGLVQAAADHFATLTADNAAILLVDGEAFRIGFAEITAPGVVTVRTFMRAELGTTAALHAIGATACFFRSVGASQMLSASALPTASAVNLYLTPNLLGGDPAVVSTTAPSGGTGHTFTGDSIRPFPPELLSATRVGNVWTIRLRPRMWTTGAGTRATIEDDAYQITDSLPGLALQFTRLSDTVTLPADGSFSTPPFTMPAAISVDRLTWTPDNGSATGGIIEAQITFASSPATLPIRAVRDGLTSTAALTIPEP